MLQTWAARHSSGVPFSKLSYITGIPSDIDVYSAPIKRLRELVAMTNFLRIVVAFSLLVGPVVSALAAVAVLRDGPTMQSGQGVPPEPVPPQSLPAPPPPQSTAPEAVPPVPQTEPPASSTTPSKGRQPESGAPSESKADQQLGSHPPNPAPHKHKHKGKHKKTEPSKEPGTGSGPTT